VESANVVESGAKDASNKTSAMKEQGGSSSPHRREMSSSISQLERRSGTLDNDSKSDLTWDSTFEQLKTRNSVLKLVCTPGAGDVRNVHPRPSDSSSHASPQPISDQSPVSLAWDDNFGEMTVEVGNASEKFESGVDLEVDKVSEKMFDDLINYRDCAVTQFFADVVQAASPSTAAVLIPSADNNKITKVGPSPTFTLTPQLNSKEQDMHLNMGYAYQDMHLNPIDSSTASVCFATNQICGLSTESDTSIKVVQSPTSASVPSTRLCTSPVKMGLSALSPTRMRPSSKNMSPSPSIQLSPAKETVSPSNLSPKLPRLGVSALAAPTTTLLSVSSARSRWSSALSAEGNVNVNNDTTHSRSFFSAEEEVF
jgi:hypothetical protein